MILPLSVTLAAIAVMLLAILYMWNNAGRAKKKR